MFMKIINFNQSNSLFNQFLSEIRDVHIQGDRIRFRRNIERVGEIMAYEISRTLPYHPVSVQTPLATAVENVPSEQPVVATICVQDFRFIRASSTILTMRKMPSYRPIVNTSTKITSTFTLNTSLLHDWTERF